MISQIKERIKLWLHRWYIRFKIFTYLFATWAVIYSTINVCGFSAAFEYDEGLVYTSRSHSNREESTSNRTYKTLNENPPSERIKLIPFLIYSILKISGFSVEIIVDIKDPSSQKLPPRWYGSAIYFSTTSNEKYEILNRKKYLRFFASSDEGIIQAKKAGIYPLRIKRNPKSLNPSQYNPGKFSEKVIPLSQF